MASSLTPAAVPSISLLRSLGASTRPSLCRHISNWTPPEKYKDVTRLDKFHRQQKKLAKAAKVASIARAESVTQSIEASGQAGTADMLPFHIGRTRTNNLAVYEQMKNGGNRQVTQIRHLKGDLEKVREELVKVLGFEASAVMNRHGKKDTLVDINTRTGHVVVKGHRGAEIIRWASALGF